MSPGTKENVTIISVLGVLVTMMVMSITFAVHRDETLRAQVMTDYHATVSAPQVKTLGVNRADADVEFLKSKGFRVIEVTKYYLVLERKEVHSTGDKLFSEMR